MEDTPTDDKVIQNGVKFDDIPLDIVENPDVQPEPHDSGHLKVEVKLKPIGFFSLFRFADGMDRILMFFGTMAAIMNGLAYPTYLIVFGKIINIYIVNHIAKLNATLASSPTASTVSTDASVISNISISGNDTLSSNVSLVWPQVQHLIWYFVGIGCLVIILAYMEVAFWDWTAERQTHRIRRRFFDAVLRQEIGWFDTHESTEINSRLAEDIIKLKNGMGDKLATMIEWMTTFVAGYTVGFYTSWKLALIAISLAPLLIPAGVVAKRLVQKRSIKEKSAYAMAGAIAEETLANIRTVAAFGGEKKEAQRYTSILIGAKKAGQMQGLVIGACRGVAAFLMFGTASMVYWFGTTFVLEQELQGGDIVIVISGLIVGTYSLAQALPQLEYISSAKVVAAYIFNIINQKPQIDNSSEEGLKPEKVEGEVEFSDVDFSYPARPDVNVLNKVSLKVHSGQTVALVGASGCGKSTIVQLLQRFYDPQNGQIKLDSHDLRDLNTKWLHLQIGVVSQEPVLFCTTIAENIRFGFEGATQEDIETAAHEANALDFINLLPEKFNTFVGSRGAQLSGGQKQRIAIARALIRNPKILLLDEATSALDTESECVVKDALDKASKGRTTIVVAHRLSTISNADVIISLRDGQVFEQGTHDELMTINNGIYKNLYNNQIDAVSKQKKIFEEDDVFEIEDPLLIQRQLSHCGSSGRRSSRKISFDRQNSLHQTSFISDRMESTNSECTKEDEEQLNKKLVPAEITRIMKLNAPEWPYITLGCFASILSGTAQPCIFLIFTEFIGNFGSINYQEMEHQAATLSLIFFGLGFIVLLLTILQSYTFAVSGESLTMRLRELAFKSMMRQDMAWFDDRQNQVGALTARLATDASAVQGCVGNQLGSVLQGVINLLVSLLIAFISGWKLALVCLLFLPFLIGAGLYRAALYRGVSKENKDFIEKAGMTADEAIDNIRTVAALNLEPTISVKFNEHFELRKTVSKSHLFGAFYSLACCIVCFVHAAAHAFGSQLIDDDQMVFRDVIRILTAITTGGQFMGKLSSYMPDINRGKLAAAKIFKLLDTKPTIDSASDDGLKPDRCHGKVVFKDVQFCYPSRPDVQVLNKLSLSVEHGQTLALIGQSGCGKSTTVQLVERFYNSNGVTLDGISIKKLNIAWLRSQIGIVSQEPILFESSIRDNIAYGDNSRDVSMDEVITAARNANIHNFIENLPNGYDTNVGTKGTQLSGGQKQRIAIARALVRKPKVLLLDEATSALDTESELVVQEALENARQGRTCVTIAHRLSTIQNADVIAVIHNGKIIETGNHEELIKQQGYYYKLQKAQLNRLDNSL